MHASRLELVYFLVCDLLSLEMKVYILFLTSSNTPLISPLQLLIENTGVMVLGVVSWL